MPGLLLTAVVVWGRGGYEGEELDPTYQARRRPLGCQTGSLGRVWLGTLSPVSD